MRILVIGLFACLSLLSCKKGGPAASNEPVGDDPQALEKQLMALHDQVMPKLNDIQHLSSDMRKIKATVKEDEAGRLLDPDGMDSRLDALKLAEQGMWDWMKQYHDQRDSIPADQLAYFMKKQIGLLNSVNMGIDSSIVKAKKWLAQYNANGK
ncbi:MAG TPA: hypothetical protein VJ508_11175 [Saprospiraceae bacterium]|nr:hypothetical protein [Saprospiraceae bacterium]